MIEPAAALQHWGKWAVDNGNWRQTCTSVEKRFVDDTSRYRFADDEEKRFRFRYDEAVGQLAEKLVVALPDQEKLVLRARHVLWPHLADEWVARRLAMSAKAFDTVLLSATLRFAKAWRLAHRQEAA